MKIEWHVQLGHFPATDDKSFAVRYDPKMINYEFRDALSVLDTPSPQSRLQLKPWELHLFGMGAERIQRIMDNRTKLVKMLTSDFEKSLWEVLERHDTIDGYRKEKK
jgi:hypothetical protein